MSQWNCPPNWPPPPTGWMPPPGWQPDPAWGAAPPGWDFSGTQQPVDQSKPANGTGVQWYRRHLVQLAGAVLLGLIIGNALGASSASDADQRATVAEGRVQGAEARAVSAQGDAQRARDAANQADSDAAAKVKSEHDALAAKTAALDARERKITGAETAAKANSFPGEGTFQVGSDIKPGTYKSAPASSGNCYHARLNSLDSSDIIDNGNSSGPVVFTVKPTDKAVLVSGCETFNKVG